MPSCCQVGLDHVALEGAPIEIYNFKIQIQYTELSEGHRQEGIQSTSIQNTENHILVRSQTEYEHFEIHTK